jgi:hypothetical protein
LFVAINVSDWWWLVKCQSELDEISKIKEARKQNPDIAAISSGCFVGE